MRFFAAVASAALISVLTIGAHAQGTPSASPQPTPQQVVPLVAPPQNAEPSPGPGAPAIASPGAPAAAARPQRVRNTPNVSCSNWFQACRRRGDSVASCTQQRDACIQTTGCFTEPARFGGETFCKLRRQ